MVRGITNYVAMYSAGFLVEEEKEGGKCFCKLADKTLALLVLQASKVLTSL